MFSMPRPENEDRRLREFAGSGPDNYRLVSVWHDPVARVTTYTWARDDGPSGAEIDPLDEEVDVPLASLDCTAISGASARTLVSCQLPVASGQ
jgi:hypothetical protein